MANFVDIIGYQLEKIHTGVIAWLLSGEDSPLSLREQAAVIGRLAPEILRGGELTEVTAMPEYSFGRQLRIDLVLKITRQDQTQAYLLIECKTDSDVSVSQLEKQEKAFSAKKPNVPYSVIVLAVGAGQFTLKHQLQNIQHHGFCAIDLPLTLEILSNLSIAGRNHTYDDWIASLRAEQTRIDRIEQELRLRNSPWDPGLRGAGYRLKFPIFYTFYDKLRAYLENGPFQGWAIYSGGNNPVMNWNAEEGWITVGPANDSIELYWEFNWDALCLKACISNEKEDKELIAARWQRWQEIRPALVEFCALCPVAGRRTDNRHGTWVTAYKWDFNFCTEAPDIIADQTNRILSYIHPRIRQLYA